MDFDKDGFVDSSYIIEKTCFVYVLRKNEEVVYVGQTENGYSRIFQHLGTKDFDEVFVKSCDKDLLDMEEAELILKYNPKYNKTLNQISFCSLDSVKKKLRKLKTFENINIPEVKSVIQCLKIEIIVKDNGKEGIDFDGMTKLHQYAMIMSKRSVRERG